MIDKNNPAYCHGHASRKHKSPEYYSWAQMKTRCNNPNYREYSLYGGRGIKVCERWLNSFENFLEDMGSRPQNYSLDRIDVEGNYTPSNCKWSSRFEQARNKRTSLNYDFKGKKRNLKDISHITGIAYSALYFRVITQGWDLERAFNTPSRKKKSTVSATGAERL